MSIPLPDYYFDWLDKLEEVECVKHSDKFWFISTIDELNEEVSIDKNKTPFWQQLKSCAAMYKELTQEKATVDQKGNQFPLERLSSCIVIGGDNGDPLFSDPSDGYSIWCYYLDGGDVEKLSDSIKSFIKESEIIHD
jgi:hypothetical protein